MVINTEKRRAVSLVATLALIAAVPLFSSCGSEPNQSSGTSADKPAAVAAKGVIPMPVLKAADAANVCYVEPSEELRAQLSPEQYAVLVESATEPPFQNAFWDNHREGIYVDAIDGTALFASREKFDSGTGWPSFWAPIDPDAVVLVEDLSYGMRRIEVRSKASGGHLGHLFDDGPDPTGLRYCINSASLRFIPRAELAANGYGDLESLFDK
ncbi:MAG: peptide-methionine (R)-S-oxide reductase MsrB [Spirochaetales bacterium]|nr:peptide-methionine (R)-S-oxide reductase MsrB [Spirochaetales bacterium]